MKQYLNFTRRAICHNNLFFYTENKIFLLPEALLASRIINEIEQKRSIIQLEKQLERQSLHEKVLRIVRESQFQKQVKQTMSDIFHQGVTINQSIWGQQLRVRDSSPKINEQQNKKSPKRYSFCPTYMITGYIFRHIFTTAFSQNYNLLTGYFGISKTFSFLLYSILSQKIILHKLNTNIQQQQIIDVPKIIYLTYQPIASFVQSLQYKIKVQCKEAFDSNDFSYSLSDVKKEFTKHNIKTSLIIDQVNKIADGFRRYFQALNILEQVQKKNQHLSYKEQQEAFELQVNKILKVPWKQIQSQYQLGRKTMNFINQNKNFFDSIIFLSPVTIQQDISHALNLGGEAGHSDIQVISINYPQLFKLQTSKKQIVDYFLFQQHQRFFINFEQFKQFYYSLDHKDIQLKQKIRKTLFDKMTENPYLFTTPFHIRTSLVEQWNVYKNNKKNTTISKIEEFSLNNFLEHFEFGRSKLEKKVIEFVTTTNLNDEQKDSLLIKLFYQCKRILKQQPEQIYAQPIQINCNFNAWQRIKQKADKHIFKFDDNDQSFRCLLPANFLVNLLRPFVDDTLKKIAKCEIQSQFFDKFSQSIKGQILQDMFIRIISLGSPILEIQKINKSLPVQKMIEIAPQVYSFVAIPKKRNNQETIFHKNYHFLKSLMPSFEHIVKQQKIASNVFLPVTVLNQSSASSTGSIKYSQKLIHRQSQCIDFLITEEDSDKNLIIINAFYWMRHNQQSLNMKKLYDFIDNFIYFKDFDKTQTTLNGQKYYLRLKYYVLAPNLESIDWDQNTTLQTLKQRSKGKLEFSKAAENVHILNVKDSNQQNVLLDEIGFIDLQKNITVVSNEKNVQFEKVIFDRICQNQNK